MKYDQAKQLRDAGFPQGGMGSWLLPPDALVARSSDRIYKPTLEELIEACGKGGFTLLTKGDGVWSAALNGVGDDGRTPEEAVGRLWLSIKAKV
jgi:hypothetical protein